MMIYNHKCPIRVAALWSALLFGSLAVSGGAEAQEVERPRTPALELRPALPIDELARLPADTLLREPPLRYDPWTGLVRRRLAPGPLGPGALQPVAGMELLDYVARLGARERERLRAELWASGPPPEGLIPEIEDPIDVPEPLARVFGEGSRFDIEGKLHVGAIGSRSTRDPDLRSELLRRAVGGFDLDLDQILDLRVVGAIGTKLDVAVDFNSSRELDSKQLISARYTGAEDEILKRVEVGDIEVSLPRSRFLGAGIARGTFGAQMVAELGPVDLRLLGSRKEGRSTERRLTIAPRGEGVLQEVVLDIKDTQFQDDRFFLLFHPDSLEGSRIAYPNRGTRLRRPASRPAAGSLDVWLDDGNLRNNRERTSKRGTAFVDPTDPGAFPGQSRQGFFDLLAEGEDYVVTDGVVLQLKRRLDDDEILAVSYRTEGGERIGSPQGADRLALKLIKPTSPDTLDFTWDYTLRNVYSLREADIPLGSLELTIYRGNRELKRTFELVGGESRKYSRIFGVTDRNGRVAVPRILRDPFGGPDLLVFPNVRPFFQPTDDAGEPIALEVPNRPLYFDDDDRRTALDDQVYFIEAGYLSRGGITGEVLLGAANVIEGSETISIGGEELVRGEDYQIFYDLGRVVFEDPAALAERHPDAPVDIRFEVAPLFNLAPTSLMGAAGTWRLGENAAVNSTVLVQSRESLANRPILGDEPTRTLIGEIDAAWARPVPALTRWVDALPGLETEEPSSLELRGELAWSRPDPNTAGRVFLNDFENVEIARRIGLFFRDWSFSSVPSATPLDPGSIGSAAWFTFAVASREVTPDVRGFDRGENLFVVRLDPAGATPAARRASWRSIHTVISTAGEDLRRQEFVEFFVRGDRGTILVDLGEVDEDAVRVDETGARVGVGELDTEETNPDTRDNNLDVGEDTGLDGVSGDDGLAVPGDVGNDDFDRSFRDGFPANPNGTEGNNTLDTEDNDFDGILDRVENVLRWEVDLSDPRFEVPGSRTVTGFRKIRLPLVRPDARIGSADGREVRVLRLTFTEVERRTDFEIAGLEVVGSTFLKRGIVRADSVPIAGPDSDSLRISAINDLENPDYFSPPGVVALQDRADQVAGIDDVVREQSLELSWSGLPPGARGAIFRPLFDRESYIDYDEMRVWVQGRGGEAGREPEFFVAFGLDTLNVYEYGAPLADGAWREHRIDFAVFTELKAALLDSLRSAGAATGTKVSEDGRYRVRIANPSAPPPTLTDVGQLTIGVENATGAPVTGSFWIDEWRLASPVREGDLARYVRGDLRVADLGDVAVSWESRGPRYRDFGARRTDFGTGTLDVSASLRLGRFLPEAWGVAMPLTWSHSGRSAEPLFRVGGDIRLEEGSALQDEQTRTDARDVVTLRAFRTGRSENPLVAATVDRLEARLTWRRESLGSVDLDSDRDRVDLFVGYRGGFDRRPVPIGLGWLKSLPLPDAIKRSPGFRRLAEAELNVAPASVSMSAESVFEERNRDKTLVDGTLSGEREFTADTTRTLAGRARISFQPFASMRASLGMDDRRDLNFPETVVERGALGVGALSTRSFDFDWAPPVAAWLVPHYRYASSYSRDHTREASRALDSLDLRDFSVTTSQSLSVSLVTRELVGAFADGDAGAAWWERAFEPVRFDVRRQETVAYVQEEEDPGFGFSFGFGDLGSAAGADPLNLSRNEVVSVSTGFVPLRNLRLRAEYRTRDEQRRYFEGTNASSTRTWPDLELRWSGIRPPGFLGSAIATATIASEFERRRGDDRINGRLLTDSDRRIWSPAVSVRIGWANGMRTDLRVNAAETGTVLVRGGEIESRRDETSMDYLLDLHYDLRPGTEIHLPLPGFWGVELERPLIVSLTLARRSREDATVDRESGVSALNSKTTTNEIRPSIAYELDRIVSGFALSYLTRKDEKRDIRDTTVSLEAYLDFLF